MVINCYVVVWNLSLEDFNNICSRNKSLRSAYRDYTTDEKGYFKLPLEDAIPFSLKYCDNTRDNIFIEYHENLPLLQLIKISEPVNFVFIKSMSIDFDLSENRMFKLELILKKYINRKPLKESILKCQKALFDAGYGSNAYL